MHLILVMLLVLTQLMTIIPPRAVRHPLPQLEMSRHWAVEIQRLPRTTSLLIISTHNKHLEIHSQYLQYSMESNINYYREPFDINRAVYLVITTLKILQSKRANS